MGDSAAGDPSAGSKIFVGGLDRTVDEGATRSRGARARATTTRATRRAIDRAIGRSRATGRFAMRDSTRCSSARGLTRRRRARTQAW